MVKLFDRSVGKTDAVAALAEELGIEGVNPWASDVSDTIRRFKPVLEGLSPQFTIAKAADLGLQDNLIFPGSSHALADPLHLTDVPGSFPEVSGLVEFSPELTALIVPNGVLWNFEESSVAIQASTKNVIQDYSSKYCELVQYYSISFEDVLSSSRYVDGVVLSLLDDISPPNFCHWMVDVLPRLAAVGHEISSSNFYVATRELTQPYQLETLELCGVSRDRIIEVQRFEAVRAKTLLLTSDVRAMPHPCFKSAPWAIDFLRSKIAVNSLLKDKHPALIGVGKKIYISRDDAPGRRIVNDVEVFTSLRELGFDRIVMSDLPFFAQVQCMAGATHIVGLHGAALSHLAMCCHPSSVLEIFPQSYGTPAFFALAAALGNNYATYVVDEIVEGAYSQIDDITIDINKFNALTREFLT
jgi:hypothetical protein